MDGVVATLEHALGNSAGRVPSDEWVGESDHFVQFYEADATLMEAVRLYVADALRAGEAAVVIATPPHRETLEAQLRAEGLDVEAARAGDRFFVLDAAETMAQFMVDGAPHPERFAEVIGSLLMRAAANGRRVRAFGEMVALLAAEGDHAGAIRLEALWNGLQQVHAFTLFCAYPKAATAGEQLATAFEAVCTEHSRVIPLESFAELTDSDARTREVAALQQKAASLEAEVAERRRLQTELERSERELREFLENASEGLHWVAPDGVILWANRAELSLLGYSAEEYIGRQIADFHADAEVIQDILRRLTDGEELQGYEARLTAKDGSIKEVLISSNVYREDGQFLHTRCFTRDITERKQAEREREVLLAQASAAAAKLSMLSEASRILASSLDYETTLATVARLALPTLGDFGFFDVVEGDDVRRIAYAYEDQATQALLDTTRWVRSERTDINLCALSSGRSAIHPNIDDAWLQDVALSPEHLEAMRQLAFGSMLTVPLAYQGRLLGALTLFFGSSGRSYREDDLALAEELARRAAAAVSNATSFKQVQEAVSVRDDFLSIASHELRTPITGLSTQAQLLLRRLAREGTLDPERLAAGLETITAQSAKLARLIAQLMDVSRLAGGKLVLDRQRTDIALLLEQVALDASARSDAHSIEVGDLQSVEAAVDPLRLEQVLSNLVENAIKYSPAGGAVELSLRRSDTGAEIAVRDHGLGIPAEKRERIFDRFFQAHVDGHRSGMGLGLYICRQIVELHGGEIRAEFPEDGGTRFVVLLPLEQEAV